MSLTTRTGFKYNFTVQYKDGKVYKQSDYDHSEGGQWLSSFADVNIPQVEFFSLVGPKHKFTVDLKNGKFWSTSKDVGIHKNGIYIGQLNRGWFPIDSEGWFQIHTEDGLTNFRLIYFRRCTSTMNTIQNPDIKFFIGWQANTPDGRNIQYALEIE